MFFLQLSISAMAASTRSGVLSEAMKYIFIVSTSEQAAENTAVCSFALSSKEPPLAATENAVATTSTSAS